MIVTVFSVIISMALLQSGINLQIVNALRALAAVNLLSTVPVSICAYKSHKKNCEIKLSNLKQQINEFEEKLEKEKEKLNNLKNDKTMENYDKNITNVVVGINNEKIETISNITRKKQLYKFYREYFNKLKKYNNKKYLNCLYGIKFTDDNINEINKMHENNETLVKSKAKKNKKHN